MSTLSTFSLCSHELSSYFHLSKQNSQMGCFKRMSKKLFNCICEIQLDGVVSIFVIFFLISSDGYFCEVVLDLYNKRQPCKLVEKTTFFLFIAEFESSLIVTFRNVHGWTHFEIKGDDITKIS